MIELVAADAAQDVVAEISPLDGGRIARLAIDRFDLLVRGDTIDDPLAWGCYPMVPWAGRLRGARFVVGGQVHHVEPNFGEHAIHGTGVREPWRVLDVGLDHAELECDLSWPLGGRAHQHLQLTPGALVCVLTVVAGDRPMPAVVGWHPWFVKPDDDDLRFGAMYERAKDGLPTGRLVAPWPRPWDDCFIQPIGPLRLHYADHGITVTIASDCDQWVVYDEPAEATCVEPQSGPPDAFNLGLATVLAAGEMVQRTMAIAWQRTPPGSPLVTGR